MTLLGWFQRGIRYAEKSFAIRKSLGDVWGQGQSLGYHGVVLYAASRFQECVAKCRESIRLLERTGDYWEIHIARYQLAASLYHLGDHLAAVQEARTNHRSGVELGDAMAAGISLDVWSRAAPIDLPDEILQREVGRERNDAQAVCQVLLARAVGLLARRDTAGAIEVLQTAVDTAIRSGVKNAYTLPAFTWLATARRLHAQQLLGFTPAQRKAALRRAAAAARRAVRTARICANDLPQALREYAMVSAMQGKTWRARRLFARSRIVATRQAAPHEYARTLLAEGHVGLECGWPNAERQIAAARAKLREMMLDVRAWEDRFVTEGGQETLSLVDRFDSVLESGRRIAGALEEQTICTELRSAALRLLRGESCLLLQIDQDDDGKPQISSVSEGSPAGFDAAVVRTCLQTGRSIAFVEESWDDSPGALLPFVARSALCAPLHVRRQAVACLYVTHSRVRNLFGRVEERVADFIAAIAGAALENANGFRQLQLANETLERRVLERTAAVEARAEELAASNRKLAQTANELRATEERLREANVQAEAASRAKSQFLATMSHEIRTPMNGVIGMVELLRRSRMDPVQQGQLNIVKQSADALLRLLNDILDFSKIEAGKLELECHPFDLHDVVCDATQVFSLAAASKGIELVCRVASEVPRQVKGDSGRLRQVLVNLVGNAVKFTQHGTVFVEAYIERQDDGAGKAALRRPRQRPGDPARKAETDLRGLFPSGPPDDAPLWRHRVGTGHFLTIAPHDGGRDLGRQSARPGKSFPFPTSARSRRRGRRIPSGVVRIGAASRPSGRRAGDESVRLRGGFGQCGLACQSRRRCETCLSGPETALPDAADPFACCSWMTICRSVRVCVWLGGSAVIRNSRTARWPRWSRPTRPTRLAAGGKCTWQISWPSRPELLSCWRS